MRRNSAWHVCKHVCVCVSVCVNLMYFGLNTILRVLHDSDENRNTRGGASPVSAGKKCPTPSRLTP